MVRVNCSEQGFLFIHGKPEKTKRKNSRKRVQVRMKTIAREGQSGDGAVEKIIPVSAFSLFTCAAIFEWVLFQLYLGSASNLNSIFLLFFFFLRSTSFSLFHAHVISIPRSWPVKHILRCVTFSSSFEVSNPISIGVRFDNE